MFLLSLQSKKYYEYVFFGYGTIMIKSCEINRFKMLRQKTKEKSGNVFEIRGFRSLLVVEKHR